MKTPIGLVHLLVIALCSHPSHQNLDDNKVDDTMQMYADAASEFLKNPGAEGMTGALSSLIQNGGGKQIIDVLSTLGTGGGGNNDILKNLGSLLGQPDAEEHKNSNIDNGGADILSSMLQSVLSATATADKREGPADGEEGMDLLSMFSSLATNVKESTGQNIWEYLPMILQTVGSFSGEAAHEREAKHESHAADLPPVLEKVHIYYDHFINSEMGQAFFRYLGTEKMTKIFADENGEFSYRKFSELMENHSFRKHWIELITRKLANLVAYFADPDTQKRFATTSQYLLNSFLKSQGFPRSTMLDVTRPSDSITAAVNHFFKKYFNYKVSAKQYVKPMVQYVQELLSMAHKKGFLIGSGVNSRELSNKIADTINMEIIEPVARVLRGNRFIKKVPQCDKYVMCLVNREDPNQEVSLPGLKKSLSLGASLVASWFITSGRNTSYWDLYNVVVEEHTKCNEYFNEPCHEFHLEEIRVTTEYVHNEL